MLPIRFVLMGMNLFCMFARKKFRMDCKMTATLLLIVSALTSCKTATFYTTLDILRPAQVYFDPDVQRLLIINNSAIQPAEQGHTLSLPDMQPQKVSVSADSVSFYVLGALAEEMEATAFFESVELLPVPPDTSRQFGKIVPLQYASILQLCDTYEADAVLSLDHVQVSDELYEYYVLLQSGFIAALDVKVETLWSLHYPGKAAATPLHFKDSLSWEAEAYNRGEAIAWLPDRQDALIDAALWAGRNSTNRFIPHWVQSDRYFYYPDNEQMKQGMDSVYVRNWAGAAAHWQQVYDQTQRPKLKAQAANNLAIAYEIMGDYEKAYSYASSAFDLFVDLFISDRKTLFRLVDYMSELRQRSEEIEILNKQLGE